MKNTIFIALTVLTTGFSNAQTIDLKPVPQINVAGQGKVKVTPDKVTISIGIETLGSNATDVKKQNDQETEKVVQYLKKANLPKGDIQTQSVSLQPNYDYQKKKYSYRASQTIQVILRDLARYDELMGGLTESGINLINNVEFQSSKIEQYKSEARKLAMQDAQNKAKDYVSVLNQKVGKAITISDNSEVHFPSPVMYKMAAADMEGGSRETLALGEIEVTANVQVSFSLE